MGEVPLRFLRTWLAYDRGKMLSDCFQFGEEEKGLCLSLDSFQLCSCLGHVFLSVMCLLFPIIKKIRKLGFIFEKI